MNTPGLGGPAGRACGAASDGKRCNCLGAGILRENHMQLKCCISLTVVGMRR